MPTAIGENPVDRPNAFAHTTFRLFWVARICAVLAIQMQTVAVGWHMYAITGSAFALGLVGLVQFLPSLALMLVAGPVADRFDRKAILRTCWLAETCGAAALAWLALSGASSEWPIYAAVLVLGTARAFEMPASAALLPNLVPQRDFPNAVAWNSSAFQGASIAGPALGGLLYIFGPHVVFALCAALLAVAAVTVSVIRVARRKDPPRRATWSELIAGFSFIRARPVVLGAISLDMIAVLLGGATALLPVVAHDVLQAGPEMLGALRSAPAIGALVVGVWLARRPPQRHVGALMLIMVAVFGLGTIVFGLSRSPWLSLVALAVIGGADMVSVVIRQTLVQLWTPDEMRGRVAAVNALFIGTSNQLGEFESGVTAAWFGTVPAIVAGGVGTLVTVLVWAFWFPQLRRVDRLEAPPGNG